MRDVRLPRELRWALLGGLLGPAAALVSGALAYRLRRPALIALAGLDALLLLVSLLALLGRAPPEPVPDAPWRGPKIGVRMDVEFEGPGARIWRVEPGSPAAKAGLRPADVIRAVDGATLTGPRDLIRAIGGGESAPRRLLVERGGATTTVTVEPRFGLRFEQDPLLALPPGASCAAVWTRALPWNLPRSWLLAMAMFLVLAAGAQPPMRRYILGAIAALLVSTVLAPPIIGYASCRLEGQLSSSAGALALLGGALTMLILGAGLLRGADRAGALRMPALPIVGWERFEGFAAVALGLITRAAAFTFAAWLTMHEGAGGRPPPLMSEDPVAQNLLLIATVLVGPAGEELLFRGVLLPALVGVLRPLTAIAVVAAGFALFHLPSHGFVAALVPFLLGAVLGWVRWRSGRVALCVALHIFANAVGQLSGG